MQQCQLVRVGQSRITCSVHQPAEPVQINTVRVEIQQVPARLPDHPDYRITGTSLTQDCADPSQVDIQCMPRPIRRATTPDPRHDGFRRHRSAHVHRKSGHHVALPRRPQVNHLTREPQLHRTQQPQLYLAPNMTRIFNHLTSSLRKLQGFRQPRRPMLSWSPPQPGELGASALNSTVVVGMPIILATSLSSPE